MIVLLLLAAGCRRPPPPPPPPPAPTAEELEAERQRRQAEERARSLGVLERNAAGEPTLDQVKALLANLDAFLPNALGTPLEARTQALITTLKERLETLAMENYQQLLVEAERLAKLSSPDYRGAADYLYEQFDKVEFEGTQAVQLVDDKIEEYRTFSRAEYEAEEILRVASGLKRQNELVRAIALLESFSDRYRETPYYVEVRRAIEEYYPLYKEELVAEQEQLAIEWSPLSIESLVPHASSESIFKQSGNEYRIENTTEGPAQLVGGEDAWIDWFLEFDVFYEGGEELTLGVRSREVRGASMRQYEAIRVVIPTGEWLKLRLEVREGQLGIINVNSLEVLHEPTPLACVDGGFCFYVLPNETVAVRDLRYKLFHSRSSEQGDAADGASGSDPKKG